MAGAALSAKGSSLNKMASQVGDYHPKFEGGKVVSAVVMHHRHTESCKANKTKQKKTQAEHRRSRFDLTQGTFRVGHHACGALE